MAYSPDPKTLSAAVAKVHAMNRIHQINGGDFAHLEQTTSLIRIRRASSVPVFKSARTALVPNLNWVDNYRGVTTTAEAVPLKLLGMAIAEVERVRDEFAQ